MTTPPPYPECLIAAGPQSTEARNDCVYGVLMSRMGLLRATTHSVPGAPRAAAIGRRCRVALAGLIGAVVLLAAAPSPASAATVTVCASGCTYTAIQPAVTAALSGDTVSVAAGTYTEQVVIDKNLTLTGAGSGTTIIQAPDPLVLDVYNRYNIVLFNGSITVEFSGFTVQGPRANLNFGIAARGGATANIHDNTIKDIRDSLSLGAQRVKALIVDGASTATITNNTIIGYQKEAINVWASSATITGNTITGDGPIATITQNGIVIASGSTATVTNNTVTGNAYDGPSWTAIGILAYGAGPGVTIQDNTVNNNSANIVGLNSDGIQIEDNQVSDSSPVDQNAAGGITVQSDGLPLTGITISGNTVQNNLSGGVSTGAGLDLYNINGATVSGNTVNGAYSDGILIGESGNIAFTNNQFSGNGMASADPNAAAINFGGGWGGLNPLGGFTVHNNTFSGNKNTIRNFDDPGVVNATSNWWGNASGPGVLTRVTTMPWCTDSSCSTLSTNANLTALSLSSGTLSPAFNSSTIAYSASVDNSVSSVTVNKTASPGANAVVSGGSSLAVGSNTVTVDVTSADGSVTKAYTVTVNRSAAATVSISASPASLITGNSSTLSWSSSNVSSCSASGSWSGSQSGSGSASTGVLVAAGSYTYTLSCTGPGGSANASTTVTATPPLTPPVDQPQSVIVTPDEPGTVAVEVTNGTSATPITITTTWDPGTFTEPVTVTATPRPPTPGGFAVGSTIIQLTVTDAAGNPVTQFAKPLRLRISASEADNVPAYSQDGTSWRPIPRLTSLPLPPTQEDGYFVNTDGSIDIYTRHATFFGLVKATKFKISSVKAGLKALTSTVVLPGRGALAQIVTRKSATGAVLTVCKTSAKVTKAGKVKLTCKLSSATRAALRQRSLRVSVKTTFTPTGGLSASKTQAVTLKSQRPSPPPYTG